MFRGFCSSLFKKGIVDGIRRGYHHQGHRNGQNETGQKDGKSLTTDGALFHHNDNVGSTRNQVGQNDRQGATEQVPNNINAGYAASDCGTGPKENHGNAETFAQGNVEGPSFQRRIRGRRCPLWVVCQERFR